MIPPNHTCGIGGRNCLACAWEEKLARCDVQLSLWRTGALSPIPEVRDSAPLWPPESAAGNAAELERLVKLRGGPPTEIDCPWCGQAVVVVADLGVSAGGGAWTQYAGLADHQRPDGQRCRGTYEALADLRERA